MLSTAPEGWDNRAVPCLGHSATKVTGPSWERAATVLTEGLRGWAAQCS